MDACLKETSFVLQKGLALIKRENMNNLEWDQSIWRKPRVSEVCGMLKIL